MTLRRPPPQKVLASQPAQQQTENKQNPSSDSPSDRSIAQSTRAIAWLTAALVFTGVLSAIVTGAQWWEIHSGSADTHALAQATVASGRAWVGPVLAKQDGSPEVGKDLTGTILYQNSGKEPATEFDAFTTAYIRNGLGFPDDDMTEKIEDFMSNCQIRSGGKSGGVVFPSAAFGNEVHFKVRKQYIDQSLVEGAKTIIVLGCFAYKSFSEVRHSTFCFMDRTGLETLPNLAYCPLGFSAN